MYRPGVPVDPWYENFKFFLTYWLLSSNNRDRMGVGDVDQLPPQPPGPPYMSHQKPGAPPQPPPPSAQGSLPGPPPPPQQKPATSPGWDSQEKHPNSPRQTLNDSFSNGLTVKPPHLPSPNGHGHPGNPHGNQGLQPDQVVVDKDKRHVCPHCYKGFRSRQQLNQHNLVHSGVRKYHCHYCERSFKQLSHLQQHHRIHTGEKPYKCPLDGCDKAFAQMSNLQHHMRQHDKNTFGQKQCMCPFCDRGYASEKSLKSHVSKMHPDSKMLNLSPRPKMNLMEGPHHPLMGGSQSAGPITHRHSLPTMHHRMKSPMSPTPSMGQVSGPLELTVSSMSHQRNSLPGALSDKRNYLLGDTSTPKFSMGSEHHEDGKYLQRNIPDRDHNKFMNSFDQRYGLHNHHRDPKFDRPFEPFAPRYPHDKFDSNTSKMHGLDNFGDFRPRFPENHIHPLNRRDDLHLIHGQDMMNGRDDLTRVNNTRDDLSHLNNARDDLSHLNNTRDDLSHLNNGRDDLPHLNNGRDDLPHLNNGRDEIQPMSGARDDMSRLSNGRDDLRHLSNGRGDLHQMNNGRPIHHDDLHAMNGHDDITGRLNRQDDLHHLKDDMSHLNGRDDLHHMNQQNDVHAMNGHDDMTAQDVAMKYGDPEVIKRPPSSNQNTDPNMIRQRKRKPANPQHVFMPSIDQYTSFVSEEIDDCGALMMDVDHAGNPPNGFERKITRADMRD